ncbi:m7GpppX diphosphatase-like [Portunus trituberculatus]|uniref:m7GpppX diphosphatase n=1 Tax=Portunus trituberculatus TaxID=210409 RepID=A0A5B7D8V3_PORTR|nr:m7GpppX diphosphatase-like [Portunus trituberculatus]XP_045123486.1 m7GpppX diphosphatase-like [Portunus trituberculatus]MPC17645.1 m7GpppX diphosphatase [Portunus trituberculatus]
MAEATAKGACSPPTKKQRTDDCSDAVDSTTDQGCVGDRDPHFLTSFKDFEVVRVLNNDEERKSVVVECQIKGREGVAVAQLQKLPFNAQKLGDILSSGTTLKTLFQNDIYYNKTALVPPDLNEMKATVIYPAEKKHILRYEKQPSSFIQETPRLFREVTKRFIETSSFSKEWIYNILDHKKEVDRIVFEDPDPDIGFILVPDLKWTGEQMEDLYLQAIVRRRDITCLRELDASHLPLLRNVLEKGSTAIKEKYGIPAHKLRVYLHYLPSFYHLHVHFSALSFEAPGTWAGKAHLLSSVISNIETCSDHYQKVTLPYTLKDNTPLSAMFKDHGYFSE